MKKIMYRAVFNRKNRLRNDGRGLVQIEAYLERQRMYVSTHIYIYSTQWDERRRQICHHAHAEELNWMVTECMMELERMELALWKRGEEVSLKRMKECLRGGESPRFVGHLQKRVFP